MFDNVGRNLDTEANRRSAISLFATLWGLSGVVGFVTAATMYAAVEVALQPVEIPLAAISPDEPPPLEAPPPPPPPVGRPDVEETRDPEQPPENVIELPPDVPPEVAPNAQGGGDPNGADNGAPGGQVGGDPWGDRNGQAGGTMRVFHHSELRIKRQVVPEYPAAAKAMGLGEQRCVVTVRIDDEGVPFEAEVAGCPKVFHDGAREGILKWRWYPARVGKQVVSAQTAVVVVYRLE